VAKYDEPITMGSLGNVLFNEMKEGKSPGSNGLTTIFYKKFLVHSKITFDRLSEKMLGRR
jgi:hypothetical protein